MECNAFEKLSENLECVSDFDVKAEALIIAMSSLIESENCDPGTISKAFVSDILTRIVNNIKDLPQCEVNI